MPFADICLEQARTCLQDIPVVTAGQNTKTLHRMQLRNRTTGEVIDLTEFGIETSPEFTSSSGSSESSESSSSSGEVAANRVEIIAKEMPEDKTPVFRKVVQIEDAAEGKIIFELDTSDTRFMGILIGTALIFENDFTKRIFPFWVEIEMSMETIHTACGLLTAEVRLALRDVCPDRNFLIDRLEFSQTELVWAMRRPIDHWNETPPPVGNFTPLTFPYRYHYMQSIIGELYYMVAYSKRRNDLDYSAAGVSVQDTADHGQYEKIANDRKSEYIDWMRQKKIQLNVEGGFSILQSGYQFGLLPR